MGDATYTALWNKPSKDEQDLHLSSVGPARVWERSQQQVRCQKVRRQWGGIPPHTNHCFPSFYQFLLWKSGDKYLFCFLTRLQWIYHSITAVKNNWDHFKGGSEQPHKLTQFVSDGCPPLIYCLMNEKPVLYELFRIICHLTHADCYGSLQLELLHMTVLSKIWPRPRDIWSWYLIVVTLGA